MSKTKKARSEAAALRLELAQAFIDNTPNVVVPEDISPLAFLELLQKRVGRPLAAPVGTRVRDLAAFVDLRASMEREALRVEAHFNRKNAVKENRGEHDRKKGIERQFDEALIVREIQTLPDVSRKRGFMLLTKRLARPLAVDPSTRRLVTVTRSEFRALCDKHGLLPCKPRGRNATRNQ